MIALLLCVTLLFSACAQEPVDEAIPTATPEPTPTPAPLPADGGQLKIPMPVNPFVLDDSTDDSNDDNSDEPIEGDDVVQPLAAQNGIGLVPLTVNTTEMRDVCSLITEPLLRADANNRLTPSLAELWSVDDSGFTWTLKLRSGVNWHDGNGTLDVSDVVYTMNMILDLGVDSYYFDTLNKAVESFVATDESTLTVTMKTKGISGLYALTFPVIREGSGGDSTIVGTGPYAMDSYVDASSGQTLDLVANEAWWKESPYITSVRCFSRESNSVALDGVEAGLLNFVPTDNVASGRYREEGFSETTDIPTEDAEVLITNHNNPILMDLNVRKAIAVAINRSEIVSNVYMNKASICDVPVPTNSFLYSAESKIYDYSPSTAETLLTEAGYIDVDSNGVREKGSTSLSLTILVNDSTENTYRKSAAELIAAQLREVGFDITVVSARYSISDGESEYLKLLETGAFDLALVGYNMPIDGDLSAAIRTGGERNYGDFSSSGIDTALINVQNALDETTMREEHAKLQKMFVDELPFIMLYFRVDSIVYGADIQGISDIRSLDVFRTVERWYMNTAE